MDAHTELRRGFDRSFCFRQLRERVIAALILSGVVGCSFLFAAASDDAFESANLLYEQGKFTEAAASYESILKTGRVSAELYFNLGNALFRSGQVGRAILNYRLAEELAPRDPDISANLQFARNSVSTGGNRPPYAWRRWTNRLTLDEWTSVTAVFCWLWFVLLIAERFRPALRKSLRGYTATAGVTAALLALCLGVASYGRLGTHWATIVTEEAVVRYGPLDESQSHYSLRDGAEVTVTDHQKGWFEVKDSAGRKGWLRREQVILLHEKSPSGKSHK
jgi:tetratricopeptide (TPR) repeat protein